MEDFNVDDLEFIPRPDLIGYEEKCPMCGFPIFATQVEEDGSDGWLSLLFECPACLNTHCLAVNKLPDRCRLELALPFDIQIELPGAWH